MWPSRACEGGLLLFTPKDMTRAKFEKNQILFSEGDLATSVYYIEKGIIALTRTSAQGKTTTIAVLRTGAFIGEDCILAGHPRRIETAIAVDAGSLIRISKSDIIRKLHRDRRFSDAFISCLVDRKVEAADRLVAQVSQPLEKRLAALLLLLSENGKHGESPNTIPDTNQTRVAEMIGGSRSRVSTIMRRFEKLGLIGISGQVDTVGLRSILQE
jgi:CRP/FNR family transcriptional regulator, cyclic AMP receptor protein